MLRQIGMPAMLLSARNFVYHVLRNLGGHPSVRWPLGAYLYVTYRCNLACRYCNDGLGNKYPDKRVDRELSTGEWITVLDLLRRVTDFLIVTGGEPSVRPDLADILAHARAVRYRPVSLLTNGLRLDTQLELLKSVDILAVSLDTLDSGKGDAVMGMTGAHQRILRNLDLACDLRRIHRFSLCVIACILPNTLDDVNAVLDYALERGIRFAPAPASGGTTPVPGLAGNPRYEAFIGRLIELKRAGHPILGSLAFLEALQHFRPYRCLPTLLARVKPNGELLYPCSKLFTTAGNLLEDGDYDRTAAEGVGRHGPIGHCSRHCHDGCYMDFSLLAQQPGRLLQEVWLRIVRQPWRRAFLDRSGGESAARAPARRIHHTPEPP